MNPNLPLSKSPALAPSIRHQDIISAYARWAPVYDTVFGVFNEHGRRAAVAAIPDNARDVIELGVGTGISLPFHRPTSRIVGVDLSPDMLDCARRLVAGRRLTNVEAILEMDVCAMTFPDDSFDAAVAMYVVTCVPDRERMLQEAWRILRPGGKLIVVSRFAAQRGVRAFMSRVLTPVGHLLGFNTTVTVESLANRADLPLVSNKGVGISGYFRLLEFDVIK